MKIYNVWSSSSLRRELPEDVVEMLLNPEPLFLDSL